MTHLGSRLLLRISPLSILTFTAVNMQEGEIKLNGEVDLN